jgi:competence protein ComEC
MTDRLVVLTALLAAVAAWWHPSVPWFVAVLLAAAALVLRRPVVATVAVVAVVCAVASWSMAGLRPPTSRRVAGVATVWADPVRGLGGVQAEVRVDGAHYAVQAASTTAATLAAVEVGDRVELDGRIVPFARSEEWAVARHLRGTIQLERLRLVDRGIAPFRIANGVRHLLSAGTTSLDGDRRALFDGIVIGDDRDQSELMAFRFRASGLGHLLAVSGQNVAFVLVAARPLLSRLRLRWRWAATLTTLAMFSLVTRWEPSVLRAVVMAAVVATAGLMGRHASAARVVSVAIIVLLSLDPLLVHSFGFRLSVAATVALVALARPLARRLPGPRWFAQPSAVVIAAHLGTAPLLLAIGQRQSVASLPANLVAVPIAGWVMVWGLTAGLVAGWTGGLGATILHLPTRVLLWWIDGVAALAARPAMPRLGWPPLLAVAVTIGVVAVTRGRWRRLALAPAAVALLLALPHDGPPERSLGRGATRIDRDGVSVVVLSGLAQERSVLDALGDGGCPDLMIVTSGRSRPAGVVASTRALCGHVEVLAADPTTVRDARQLPRGIVRVGTMRLGVSRRLEKWSVRLLGR